MKKEKLNYFDEFVKASSFSAECAKLLSSILKDFNKDELSQNINEMHKIERSADDAKHELTSFLLKDFLPPIEREDIIKLSHRLDNLTDNIEEVLIKIDMFNVCEIRPEISEFLALLTNCCRSINNLMIEFKTFKKNQNVGKLIISINHLEEEGDSIYAKYMKNLYLGNDIREILIWTELFDCFENCFDNCEQIANAVETIILKNS